MQKRGSKAGVKYRILGRRHGFAHLKTKNRDIIKKSAIEIINGALNRAGLYIFQNALLEQGLLFVIEPTGFDCVKGQLAQLFFRCLQMID